MKFPWVSRERLEDAQKQLGEANAERQRLLDLLLSGAVPDRRQEIEQVNKPVLTMEQELRAGLHESQGSVTPFTTPFDRLNSNFAKAFPTGGVPAKFKARA